jgi:hypothetical protein
MAEGRGGGGKERGGGVGRAEIVAGVGITSSPAVVGLIVWLGSVNHLVRLGVGISSSLAGERERVMIYRKDGFTERVSYGSIERERVYHLVWLGRKF